MAVIKHLLQSSLHAPLWTLARITYRPTWINGNAFQQWWYFKHGRLLEYLITSLESRIYELSKEVDC